MTLTLPDASTPDGILQASGAIMKAVAEGELAVSTGKDLMDMLDSHRRGLELTVIEERLQALEAASSGKS